MALLYNIILNIGAWGKIRNIFTNFTNKIMESMREAQQIKIHNSNKRLTSLGWNVTATYSSSL